MSNVAIQEREITVSTGRFCTQLTHCIQRPSEGGSYKIEVIDYCTGTKIVNVVAMEETFKFHDGCLRRISSELGKKAKQSIDIIIDDCFDAFTVKTAFTYILKPNRVKVKELDGIQRSKMVKFGARYGLPPKHMSKLIDRSNYAELVEYAWENENTYLMRLLPKMRVADVQITEDFKNIDDKITYEFLRSYLDHDYFLKKCRRVKICVLFVIAIVWFFLFYLAFKFDGKWIKK